MEADPDLAESSRSTDNEDTTYFKQTEKTPSDADVFKNVLQDENSNESIKTWLQRITQIQNEIQKKLSFERGYSSSQASLEISAKSTGSTTSTSQTTNRVVKYQDLPYMGEMTLDNSKPRRGRKPKKADICHLIYKNYGTIYPGTPNPKSLMERSSPTNKKSISTSEQKFLDVSTSSETFNRSDVQNRIICSLLEKRLTQESRRNREASYRSEKIIQKSKEQDQFEPLNLCIRDLNQLKIRLLENKSGESFQPEVKSEPHSDDEVEFVQESPSIRPDLKLPNFLDHSLASSEDAAKKESEGYVYWPNGGVFIHPLVLQQQLMYYQRLNSSYALPSHSGRPPPDILPTTSIPELRKLVPKPRTKKTETQHDDSELPITEQKTKRNAPSSTSEKTPTKRKRSAIFIPPIPTENQTNPATEVSICKFKFTGGAKPSLQEKKMLSVDSGGNFRYYSGTGDKSMRGYEFFPRETLQQQIGNSHGSSTGAFLQASGEKIYPGSPVDFVGKQTPNDFLLTPELPSTSISSLQDLNTRHNKKRKSRKSLQREKLEQTFKEKGFLIQTQQLESAEGATYCKFRQLRKFTRYLFRSWKDYLPGNVRELQEGEKSETDEVPDQSELDSLSRQSSNNEVAASAEVQ